MVTNSTDVLYVQCTRLQLNGGVPSQVWAISTRHMELQYTVLQTAHWEERFFFIFYNDILSVLCRLKGTASSALL